MGVVVEHGLLVTLHFQPQLGWLVVASSVGFFKLRSVEPISSQYVQQKQAAQQPEQLQNQVGPAYVENFLQQYNNYKSNVENFRLQPNKPSKELA